MVWTLLILSSTGSDSDSYSVMSFQKVEHAGYTRYILQRNPPRYDSEGDELDDDDADSDADAAAAEENPFSEIALERQSSRIPSAFSGFGS
jgi:RXT2-like, N-terminal